ncbi:unnamed protein product, partial [Arabidopsis halleri]
FFPFTTIATTNNRNRNAPIIDPITLPTATFHRLNFPPPPSFTAGDDGRVTTVLPRPLRS